MTEELAEEQRRIIKSLLVDLRTCLRDRIHWMESSREGYARQMKEHEDRVKDLGTKIRVLEQCLEEPKKGKNKCG